MKKHLLAMMLVLSALLMYAQTNVSGTVVSAEDDAGIPGVNVVVQGTSRGTITDVNGTYSLTDVPDDAILQFSAIGFMTQSVPLNGRSQIDVAMDADVTELDEIVVTGYGTQIKRDMTSSISKVDGDDLQSFPATSVDQSLQGLAPGVNVQAVSGVPGAPTRVLIRGVSSLTSATEPLWIIDGMILQTPDDGLSGRSRNSGVVGQNPLALINPNDIESIEVLKDAAATAIYGQRGVNGVIIITTKTGKGTRGTVNVNYQQGVTNVVRGPEDIGYVNGDTWLTIADEALANTGSGLPPFDPNSVLNEDRDPNAVLDRSQTVNTNWFDQVMRQGSFQDLNISTSKGSENTSFYISGQYRRDEGFQVGNDFQRASLRSNVDFKPINNLDVGLRLTLSYVENERAPNGGAPGGNSNIARPGYNAAVSNIYPWLPIFHPTAVDSEGNPILFDPLSGRNPLASLNRDNYINDLQSFRSIGGLLIDYHIPWVDGLKIHGEGSFDFFQNSNIEWGNTQIREDSPYGFDNSTTFNRYVYNFYLNYAKDITENHNLSVTVGTESTAEGQRSRNIEADQLVGTAQEIGTPGNVQRVSNGYGNELYYRSYFGRLNYKFMDRYLLGASFRYDGTSIFTEENRWAFYPSLSAGWIISEENFMNSSWLNFLKLRASWGQNGNANIDRLATFTTYTGWGRYGDVGAGDLLTRIGNQSIEWETVTKSEVAVDFEMMEGRFSGSVAYYHQNVQDMLYTVRIPQSSGIFSSGPTIWDNIGDMKVWGWEFQVNAIVMHKGDFRWNVGFNFTTNQNEVTDLANPNAELWNRGSNGLIAKVGEPIGYFRLANYAGINEVGGYEMIEELDADRFAETGERVGNGNLIPATRRNMQNNLIDNTDKTALPRWFGGFNTSVEWMGFDLSAFFTFQGGNWIYDAGRYSQTIAGSAQLRSEVVGNTWTPENTTAEFPQLVWNRRYDVVDEEGNVVAANQRFDPRRGSERHDKYLQKGDFLRLRTLTIGYSLPNSILEKVKLQKVRIFFMANNLWTVTGYEGIDPETANVGGGARSRNIEQGWVGATQLPQLRTFSGGINVGF